MQLYSGYSVSDVLEMPSITFLVLLNEGHKLDIYEKKMLITIASFPNMEKDDKEQILENLKLPDDQLNDILETETKDDINILEDILNNGGN